MNFTNHSLVDQPCPGPATHPTESDSGSDMDSLFDEPPEAQDSPTIPQTLHRNGDLNLAPNITPARLTVPPIAGLYFNPNLLLPVDLIQSTMQKCLEEYFQDGNVNQIMLFERADRTSPSAGERTVLALTALRFFEDVRSSGLGGLDSTLPSFLADLLVVLCRILQPVLPDRIHHLLFPYSLPSAVTTTLPPPKYHARQVIINHYLPGEGITPHVDLLKRFGDGIIGVSTGSGCVMQFKKVQHDDGIDEDDEDRGKTWDVFLPSGSVYVMSEEARYEWTHGIEKREKDWVESSLDQPPLHLQAEGEIPQGRWIPRSVRVSITFRWLLPGADVVGMDEP